jgi:hypothetical protein
LATSCHSVLTEVPRQDAFAIIGGDGRERYLVVGGAIAYALIAAAISTALLRPASSARCRDN